MSEFKVGQKSYYWAFTSTPRSPNDIWLECMDIETEIQADVYSGNPLFYSSKEDAINSMTFRLNQIESE